MKNLLLLSALFIGMNLNAQCTLSASFTYYEDAGNIYFTNTSTNEPSIPYYYWWFDSQSSTAENPVFSTTGLYGWTSVCLMVYDTMWTCVDSICANVFIDSSGTTCNLNADFSYYESGGNIYLTNTSTDEPSGAMYDWWFGSQSSNLENPVFSTAGMTGWQTVCLLVYDATWSCVDSICSDVYIDTAWTGCNVNADFSYYETGGNLYLTNTSTDEPSGAQYDWWFGSQNSNLENPVFSTSGMYGWQTVCLTVYDATWSCYDSTCTTIFIDSASAGCNVNASFTYSASGGNITFTNTSTDEPTNAYYDWWFGSQNSSQENPTFSTAGMTGYQTVCLTVYDSTWNCYDSTCTTIYVDSLSTCTLTTGFSYVAYGGYIYFTDNSTNVPIDAQYDWWYNGQNSADQNPVFVSFNGYKSACLTVHDPSWTCYDSTCAMVFVDSTADTTVTVNELELNGFEYYPNPVSNELNINIGITGNFSIAITDVTGRAIRNEYSNEEKVVTIDLSELPEGLYFITVFDSDNPEIRKTEKFIKR